MRGLLEIVRPLLFSRIVLAVIAAAAAVVLVIHVIHQLFMTITDSVKRLPASLINKSIMYRRCGGKRIKI